MQNLAELFRALSPGANELAGGSATLELALARTLAAGRSAWPEVVVSDESFVRHLVRHHHDERIDEWLARIHAAGIYLACACYENSAGAIEAFERVFMPKVRRIVERERSTRHLADELQQRIREKLFVGGRKIGEYSGRGTLEKWLEVVVLRAIIDLSRQRREGAGDSIDSMDGVSLADPELQFIKERYRAQFKTAFHGAIERLSPDQRNLLRLHYVDGVTLDQLSALLHVHRSTVASRLAVARGEILEGAQRLLAEELKLAPGEVESLLRVMRSQLDISISILMASAKT